MTSKVEMLMKALDISKDEAENVIECDKVIDRGGDPFPLSPQQKAVEKVMKKADRTPTIYQFKTKSHKANADKIHIMETLSDVFQECEVEMVNPEREMLFNYNGVKYKLVLSCPRK